MPNLRLNDGYEDTSPELRDSVVELQRLLVANGLEVELDGLFGPGTHALVKWFQREHGLREDGIVGAKTWAALRGGKAAEFPTTIPLASPGMLAQAAEAEQYRASVVLAAGANMVPICVLAGIGSRESGWGLALRPKGPKGTGDFAARAPHPPVRPGKLPPDGGGFGRGLLQIDYDAHSFARSGRWADAANNIAYGATVLKQNYDFMRGKTGLQGADLWRGALSGYNCGAGNVVRAYQAGRDLDYYTSGRDYGRDTLDRAGWFLAHGWVGKLVPHGWS